MRRPNLVLLTALSMLGSHIHGRTRPVPRQVTAIALPDIDGRIDHFRIDASRKPLFAAALGNNTVEVVDLKVGNDAEKQGVRAHQCQPN